MGAGRGWAKACRGSRSEALLRWFPVALLLLSSAAMCDSAAVPALPDGQGSRPILPWVLAGVALLLAGAALGIAFQWRFSKKKNGGSGLEDRASVAEPRETGLGEQDWRALWAECGKDALYIHDREGRFVRFIAPELCGIEPEAAVGHLPGDLFPAQVAQALLSRVQQVVTTGAPLRTDISETWRGREHQFTEFATPIFDGGGQVTGVVRYCRNLTSLREAEGATRQATLTLQALLANLPGMAYRFRLTPGWPFDFISDGTTELTGHPQSHFLGPRGTRFQEVIVPEDRERRSGGIERAVREGRPFRISYRIQTASGQTRWLLDQGRPLAGADGEAEAVEGFAIDITARVTTENALLRSERDYRLLVEHQSEFVVKVDGQGRFLFVSPSFCDFLGIAEQDLLKTDFLSICQEEFRPVVPAAFQQLREPPCTAHFDHRAATRHGLRWLAWSFKGVLDEEGRVAEAVGVGRDTTAQRAISDALSESESRFRTLAETTTAAIFILRGNRVTYSNPGAELLSGRSAQELRQIDFWEELFPAQPDLSPKGAAGQQQGSAPLQSEARLRQKDRAFRWVQLTVAQTLFEGRPAQIVTAFDITTRKEAEAATQESEIKYRRIFEGISDGVYLTSAGGQILLANPALLRMLGYRNMQELLALDVKAKGYADPEYRTRFAELMERDGQVTDFESQWLHRDGSVVVVMENARGIRGPDGRVAFYEGTVRDVTEERRSKQALLESEARYRALFDHSSDAIFLADPETGALLDANRRAQDLIGRDLDDIRSMHQIDLHPPEERTRYEEIFLNHKLDTGGVTTLDLVVQHRDGHRVPVDISGNAFRAGDRRIQMGIFRDITERKRSEVAILRERDFSVSALNSLPAIFYMLDPTGRFLRWNESLEIVGEYSAEEIGHMHPLDFFEGADKTLIAEKIFQVFSEGQATAEATMVSKSGRRTPYYFHARKIQLDGQDCLIGTGLDISERIRAEEALRESEGRLQKILEQSPIAMALVGMDGVIEFINEKAIETFGYISEDIPHMDKWWTLAYPDEAYRREVMATWTDLVGAALANNREIEGREYRVTCKDRTVKTVFIFGVPVAGKVFVMFQDVTGRRAAEAALQESETRYRIVVQQTGQVVYDYLPESDRFAWSGACEETTGWPATALPLGMAAFEALLPSEDLPAVRECYADASRSEHPFQVEHRFLRRDGSVFWAENKGVFLTGSEGRPYRILGTLSDVTVRHEALEEVMRVTGHLRHLLSATTTVLYTCRPDSDCATTFISANVYSVLGLQASDFTSDPHFWASRVHPEDAQRVFAGLPKLFESGVLQHRYRFLDGKGAWRWMQDDLRLLRGSEGAPVEIAGSWTDITDLVQKDSELRESEARFRKLFEQAQVGIAILSPSGQFEKANASFCEMLQYSEEELRALNFQEITHPDHLRQDVEGVKRLLSGEIPTYRTKKRYLNKSGEVLWANLTASVVRQDDGQPRYFFSIVEDITEQQHAEEELIKQNRQLAAILASSHAMTGFVELAPTAKALCEATLQAFGLEMVWIGLVVPESTEIMILASAGNDDGYTDRLHVRWDESPRAQGPTGRCIKSRKPEIASVDDFAFAPWREAAMARGFRTACAIPLIHEDSVRGALNLYSSTQDAFTPSTMETLQIFARQCTMVIVNAALHEEAKRAAQEMLDHPPHS